MLGQTRAENFWPKALYHEIIGTYRNAAKAVVVVLVANSSSVGLVVVAGRQN